MAKAADNSMKYEHESGTCTVTFNKAGAIQGCTNDKTGAPVNLTTPERTSIAAMRVKPPKAKAKVKAKAKAKKQNHQRRGI